MPSPPLLLLVLFNVLACPGLLVFSEYDQHQSMLALHLCITSNKPCPPGKCLSEAVNHGRLVVYCRYITWVRGRLVHGQARTGISPCCLRATPQSAAHLFLCQWQQVVRGEWHLRPPCDPPWRHYHPPFWSPDIQASNPGLPMMFYKAGPLKGGVPVCLGRHWKVHTPTWLGHSPCCPPFLTCSWVGGPSGDSRCLFVWVLSSYGKALSTGFVCPNGF